MTTRDKDSSSDVFSSLRALEQELRDYADGQGAIYGSGVHYAADKLAACLAALPKDIRESRSRDGDRQCAATGMLDAKDAAAAVRAIEADQTRPALAGSEPADSQPLAALGSPSEAWQPIESYDANTCPLDVLIAVDLEDRCVSGEARLHGDEGWYWANNHPTDAWGNRVYPYAWRELPAPPARPADTRKDE